MVPFFNATSAEPLGDKTLVLVSQLMSFTETLVYSRVLLRQKIKNLIVGLSEIIQVRPEADLTQCKAYESRALALHELLYGLLMKTGHQESVPQDFRKPRFEITKRYVESLLANALVSRAELFTVWGMLRFIAGEYSPAWQQELRDYWGIDAKFDGVICALLQEKAHTWEYRIAGTQESLITLEAYYNIVLAVVTAVRSDLTRRIILNGLEPHAYQHNVDRVLTDKILSKLSTIGLGIGKLIDVFIRWQTVNIKSGGICVNENSEPVLYNIVCNVCTTLGIPVPDVYIYDDQAGINAYTTGVEKPIIVLTRMAASMLDEHELAYIIGHECGHIMCQHVKYHALMTMLATNVIPGGQMVHAFTLAPLLNAWYRRSELSADRAGLLACQSIEAVKRAMLKMMGTPYSEFQRMRSSTLVTQALDFQSLVQEHTLDRAFNLIQTFTLSHPRTVFRCLELLNWIKSGDYDMLLNATAAERKEFARLNNRADSELAQTEALAHRIAEWASSISAAPYRELLRGARTLMLNAAPVDMPPYNTVYTVDRLIMQSSEEENLYTSVLRIRYVSPNGPQEFSARVLLHEWVELPAAAQSHFVECGADIYYTEKLYRFSNSES